MLCIGSIRGSGCFQTENQVMHGRRYYEEYKDMDQDFDSVYSDKTQSYGTYGDDDFSEDEDTEESGDYGSYGKTELDIDDDEDSDTVEDLEYTVHSTDPEDDLDLSLSDIEPPDFGTFEDDDSEYTDGEFSDQEYNDPPKKPGMLAQLRNYFSKFF